MNKLVGPRPKRRQFTDKQKKSLLFYCYYLCLFINKFDRLGVKNGRDQLVQDLFDALQACPKMQVTDPRIKRTLDNVNYSDWPDEQKCRALGI